MYDQSMKVKTPREYTLQELYDLFEAEGHFDQPYELINKGLIKHIRFPALSKTIVQVYPAGNTIVVNLTKESFLKDLALSVVTDGWSDVLSDGHMTNATVVSKIAEEVKRLTAYGATAESLRAGAAQVEAAPAAPLPPVGAPAPQPAAAPLPPVGAPAAAASVEAAAPVAAPQPAPVAAPVEAAAPAAEAAPGGLVKETMIWDGFKKSTKLQAFEDKLVTINKKGKVSEYPFHQIKKIKAKKDNIDIDMHNGDSDYFLFDTESERAQWEGFIRGQMEG